MDVVPQTTEQSSVQKPKDMPLAPGTNVPLSIPMSIPTLPNPSRATGTPGLAWPRAWELTLAFLLGICAVVMLQSAWKLMQPPQALVQAGMSVDLNTADMGTLKQLPGVGPNLAARIVEHRSKHGPFHSVDDLKAVHGIGPTTLERLRHVVMVTSSESTHAYQTPEMQPLRSGPKTVPTEPLDLNLASKEQLMTLPGIGATLADRILEERTQRGSFTTVEDLTRIRGIKGKTLEKILPYVIVKKRNNGIAS